MTESQSFSNLSEFYAFYRTQHSDPWCRYWHYLGLSACIIGFVLLLVFEHYWWLLALPVLGYSCSWIGHLFFEKNTPATFGHPFYSFVSDWLMYRDWLLSPFKKTP